MSSAVAEHARLAVDCNNAKLLIYIGDMFSLCDGKYDLIFWNPPYVPSQAVDESLKGKPGAIVADGGFEGTTLIQRLIDEAPNFVADGGRILLGFSTFYIPLATVKKIVDESALQIDSVISIWPVPSKVLVLVRR